MSDASTWITGIVFLLYLVAMLIPALYSGRQLRRSSSFTTDYFLGGRAMSSWVLAMSFAATCISGGTFAGFPAKIYSQGWIVFLWIAGYMVFPIFAMGLMGRRLHQLSLRSGAITIPDILRDRFRSDALGVFGSISITIFLVINLVSQFKAGGLILDVLLRDTPGYSSNLLPMVERIPGLEFAIQRLGTGYVLSLLLFAGIVVLYTAYGGFRAVVWTDTLQGLIMLFGVLFLLPSVLIAAGGLANVTHRLATSPPSTTIGTDLALNTCKYIALPDATGELFVEHRPQTNASEPTTVDVERGNVVAVRARVDAAGKVAATRAEVMEAIARHPEASKRIAIEPQPDEAQLTAPVALTEGPRYLMKPEDRLRGPSRNRDGTPFHPLPLALSFFFFWPFSGSGHPGFLVRLLAFRGMRDFRYAIVTVTLYFAAIYIPLVLIFVAASVLIEPATLPGGADEIMPAVAKRFAPPLLAGLLLAAPFSAVMSTVSSFLLVISSSLIRDIYQRTIRHDLSEQGMRRITLVTTVVVGAGVTFLALDPPEFLQDFVILASEGIAATFLAATFLGIYWDRMTTAGAWGAMLSGFGVIAWTQSPRLWARLGLSESSEPIFWLGIDPFLWACALSFLLGIVVSLLAPAGPTNPSGTSGNQKG